MKKALIHGPQSGLFSAIGRELTIIGKIVGSFASLTTSRLSSQTVCGSAKRSGIVKKDIERFFLC